MNWIKTCFVSIAFLAHAIGVNAQEFSIGPEKKDTNTVEQKAKDELPEEEKNKWLKKIYLGANLGAQFGNFTFVDVSPIIGYRINKRWSVGTQFTYQYMSFKANNYRNNIAGISGFTRIIVWDQFFLHGEYGVINGNFDQNDSKRENLENLFVGGGYSYAVRKQLRITTTLLYNLMNTPFHPYTNPILNMGFTYDLK